MKVRKQVAEAAQVLASFPGVVGVFWGQRWRRRKWKSEQCLSVHVRWKRPLELVPDKELFPTRLASLPIDVIEVGLPRVHALSQTDEVTAPGLAGSRRATMTALALGGESVFLLLSGHATLPIRNKKLLSSYGPDDARSYVQVHDEEGLPLRGALLRGELGDSRPVDWAVAQVFDVPDAEPFHYGTRNTPPFRVRTGALREDEEVSHFSRLRDRLVKGTFRQAAQTPVEFLLPDGRTTTYTKLLAIESSPGADFSRDGDSGSLVVDSEKRVVGAILGASADYSIAYVLPIAPMLEQLGSYRSYFFL